MKKTIFLALMALAIVAVPANAQTRKERKAAEKAKWEQQQQFDAEEAALRAPHNPGPGAGPLPWP